MMKTFFRITLLVLIALFIVVQFFQPERNNSERGENHLFAGEEVPEQVQTLLTNACLDCHSNQTRYPWYNRVAPFSWMINQHVTEGKENLNLSDWGTMDIFGRLGVLEEMVEEVEKGEMPLESYVWLHPDAQMDEENTQLLKDWTEQLSLELLNELEE